MYVERGCTVLVFLPKTSQLFPRQTFDAVIHPSIPCVCLMPVLHFFTVLFEIWSLQVCPKIWYLYTHYMTSHHKKTVLEFSRLLGYYAT